MRIIVKGKNFQVGDALRDHCAAKIQKIEKIFDGVMEAVVELTVEKNPSIPDKQHVEVTLYTKGPTIRAIHNNEDMYIAIDQIVPKLEKQIIKYKGKAFAKHPINHNEQDTIRKMAAPEVVKRKIFDLKPMSIEEAVLQIDLIGHDFFVFRNAETDQVNIIYKRADGDYGLIEPV